MQDFAGGREAGTWLGEHSPSNAVVLTMGPSLGNLVSFYGNRDFFALSVSQDPKLRNPAYRPIPNPDSAIRQMHVQYAVWDAYTADRAPFYSQRLMSYVRKYAGTPVYSVWVNGKDVDTAAGPPPPGAEVRVVIYQLVGGDPLPEAPVERGPVMLRRALLAALASGAALLAVAPAPATAQSGPTIEHLVVIMEENSTFDHTFGTLHDVNGVHVGEPVDQAGGETVRLRGFSDLGPGAFTVPTGRRFSAMDRRQPRPHSTVAGWTASRSPSEPPTRTRVCRSRLSIVRRTRRGASSRGAAWCSTAISPRTWLGRCRTR